jgi:hypothetical protein
MDIQQITADIAALTGWQPYSNSVLTCDFHVVGGGDRHIRINGKRGDFKKREHGFVYQPHPTSLRTPEEFTTARRDFDLAERVLEYLNGLPEVVR